MLSLRELQSVGLIKKVGYGTWEIIDPKEGAKNNQTTPPRRCKDSHRVGLHHTPKKVQKEGAKIKPGMIRGHGVVATVKIPRFPNWKDRVKVLDKKKIEYLSIVQGQRIKVGWIEKVWLTNKPSIVIYFPEGTSWFGKEIEKVAVGALTDTIKTITRIERMMGIKTLKIRGSYWIKFSRQHHSLIFNSLAKRYKNRGGQIYFRNEVGLWGLIDYSPADGVKLDEFETVRGEKEFKPYDPYKPLEQQIRPDNASRDDLINNKAWFDGVQRTGITPEFILNRFNDTANQIKQSHAQILKFSETVSYLDKNMESHVGAINTLSHQAQENAKTTVSLRDAVTRLSETMKTLSMPVAPTSERDKGIVDRADKPGNLDSDVRLERKACGLCGETHLIPVDKKRCSECDKMLAPYKKKTVIGLDGYDYSKPLLRYLGQS